MVRMLCIRTILCEGKTNILTGNIRIDIIINIVIIKIQICNNSMPEKYYGRGGV